MLSEILLAFLTPTTVGAVILAIRYWKQNKMLKNLISTQFGNPNVSDGDLVWNLSNSYEIVLSDYQLKINFGKSNDNELVYQQIKDLGATITKSLNF